MISQEGLTFFKKACADLSLPLTKKQEEQFITFYDLLLEKNKVMNLTAITEEHDVLVKHFLDSLSLVRELRPMPGQSVIDLGCGAGFPGLPLKILFPEVSFTLCDSLQKRIGFLNEVIAACSLSDIQTIHARAEDLGQLPMYRQSYDICVSRAVAALPLLCEYCLPLVKVGGTFVAYKSINIDIEMKEADHAIHILGGKEKENVRFHLENGEQERSLVVISKIKDTPKTYPRKAGVPKKSPL